MHTLVVRTLSVHLANSLDITQEDARIDDSDRFNYYIIVIIFETAEFLSSVYIDISHLGKMKSNNSSAKIQNKVYNNVSEG